MTGEKDKEQKNPIPAGNIYYLEGDKILCKRSKKKYSRKERGVIRWPEEDSEGDIIKSHDLLKRCEYSNERYCEREREMM